MSGFDILIAGTGAAGCAAAIALRMHAPALRVVMVDRDRADRSPPGEILAPPAIALLKQLGVRDRFVDDGHDRVFRILSSWGSSDLTANEYFLGVHSYGWRVDRVRFDAMLLERARALGAQRIAARVISIDRTEAGWTTQLDDGTQATARFALDATGRRAALLHMARAVPAPQRPDRLVAAVTHYEGRASSNTDTLLEATADGWWFATPLAARKLLVAFFSDSDIIRRLGVGATGDWQDGVAQTRFVRHFATGAHPVRGPVIIPAGSVCRAVRPDLPILAVGDAMSCFDPLSSQGIPKALRAGILAAYSVADFRGHDDDRGLIRYRRFVADEFAAYRRQLGQYYRREARWPDRPFWRRRHDEPDPGFESAGDTAPTIDNRHSAIQQTRNPISREAGGHHEIRSI